jgi:lysophospholipase L1-like esterase
MADYIAGRRDWDFATLEMGINVLGSMETAEFERRVDYFVSRIARAHPDKWLFCLSMFTFGGDLDRKNRKKGAFREIVKRAAGRAGGRAVYLDGRCLLRGYAGLMADLVHPSPAGMEEIARNLVRVMRRSQP